MKVLVFLVMAFYFPRPNAAVAEQFHGGFEGIYIYCLAHLFFMFSMIVFIFWIRKRKLVGHIGWKNIQSAAFFIVIWNMIVLLEQYLDWRAIRIMEHGTSDWRITESFSMGNWSGIIYYVVELNILILIPSLIFLWLGWRRLVAGSEKTPMEGIR